jgi:hypothetical protein
LLRESIRTGDVAAPVAAGSLLGPVGGLAAIAVAAALYLAQRSPCHRPVLMDRFDLERSVAGGGKAISDRSVIAAIESRRIGQRTGGSGQDERTPSGAEAVPLRETLPWRASLAMATLAVLMTGLFV